MKDMGLLFEKIPSKSIVAKMCTQTCRSLYYPRKRNLCMKQYESVLSPPPVPPLSWAPTLCHGEVFSPRNEEHLVAFTPQG